MGTGAVLLLDDDDDVRDTVSAIVTVACRRECVAVGSFAELTAASARVLACDAAILDINLGAGQPSGVDAYGWLRANHFAGRIFFLTGHAAASPLVKRAAAIENVRILVKPVGLDELRNLLVPGAHP